MAMESLKKRLEEIDMSMSSAQDYYSYLHQVENQINQLRVVLQGLQAKSKERVWLRHQTSGDLDDGKLIEGKISKLISQKYFYFVFLTL